MTYVLRADASQSMGSGHVMRLSALAEELIARGEMVTFIGNISEVPWVKDKMNRIGFSEILSEDRYFYPNPIMDILILDCYHLPIHHSFLIREKWKAIVVVADDATPPYYADLLIYPCILLDFKLLNDTKMLGGPKYIPLRKSISKNTHSKLDTDKLEIVVVGGGTDLYNFVGEITKILISIPSDFQVTLFSNQLKNLDLDSRFTIIPIGETLDEKVKSADLIFTTASTSSLEFIAQEVAIGVGCAVDNQVKIYDSLKKLDIAAPIGRYIEGKWEIDRCKIQELVGDISLRKRLITNCSNLVDLNGAKRIVDEIIKLN